ncbi:MAG: 3-oxoacyl-ACP reductase, partial [Acidimicrobiales bacterium]|nr:3-oxoacyl-ACP reductase [Acidimicrobiales bacterium]
RDGAAAEDTAAGIRGLGGRAHGRTVDVRSADAVEALADDATSGADGPGASLAGWVNVAGVMRSGKVVDLTEADLDDLLAVNLKGVLFGAQAAARRMSATGGGSIVNVASAILDGPQPRMGAYGMSKAAVSHLSRTLALEVGKHGVRVNVVAPGWTRTGMTEGGAADGAALDAQAALQARITPLRRVAEPADAAAAIVWLISDSARFITGQTIRPHGGITMPW